MIDGFFSPWPSYTDEEADAIRRIILSNKVNYWTGTECREFEKEFAIFSQTKYAIALANGTVALDLAFMGLGIGVGDEVIVTSRTFLASVSSIVNSGAKPVFADIDSNTQNISIDTIRRVLSDKTKAIVCVHLAGWPCDMDPIIQLANELGLFVIEDCAQAQGATYKSKKVGTLGVTGCFSFYPTKILGSYGDGGFVTTNDKNLYLKIY